MPPFQPTANMKDLMLNVIDPAADTLWESVGTIMTTEGTFEKAPATDDEWAGVRAGAIQLAEAGNLLMLPSRSGGSQEWIAESRAMIEAKDKDALFTIGGDIYDVCTNCHKQFAQQLSRPETCRSWPSVSGSPPPRTAPHCASRCSCIRCSSLPTCCS